MFWANCSRQATHLLGAVAAAILVIPHTGGAQTARAPTADSYRITPPAGWSVMEVMGDKMWLTRGDTLIWINRLEEPPPALEEGEARQLFRLSNTARGFSVDLKDEDGPPPHFILLSETYFEVDAPHMQLSNARWSSLLSDIARSLRVDPALSRSALIARRGPLHAGIMNRRAVSLPKPEYPPAARQAGASGTVVVEIMVDQEGNVVAAIAASGHPLLHEVSVAAARNAKFSPTILSGQAVKATGILVYTFAGQ